MSELISGKEAKLAWVNGEELEMLSLELGYWVYVDSSCSLDIFSHNEFRLKPRTIKINGVEIPAPFEPKHGDIFWYLDLTQICSYNYRQEWSDSDEYTQLGAWRSEEEIKQVVAALRSIFNEKTKEGDPS